MYRLNSPLRPPNHDLHLLLVWCATFSEQEAQLLSEWAVGNEGQKVYRSLLEDFQRPQCSLYLALCLGAMTSFEKLKYYRITASLDPDLPLNRKLRRHIKFLESMSYLCATKAFEILDTTQAQMAASLLLPNLAYIDPVAEARHRDAARYWAIRHRSGCGHSKVVGVL